MSGLSVDIVDQIAYFRGLVEHTSRLSQRFVVFVHHLVDLLITHCCRSEGRNNRVCATVRGRWDHNPPLWVELTPYHLLTLISIVSFGAWRILLSYHDEWVLVTRVELGVVTFIGAVYAFISQLVARQRLDS